MEESQSHEEGGQGQGSEQETMKAPLTPDNTYAQYAEGVPPPEPAPRTLDQEDEAAIAAVVGEQPSPGPGPEEREELARQHLQEGGLEDSTGGTSASAGEQQQGKTTLGDLMTEQATAHEQPAEAREATEAEGYKR